MKITFSFRQQAKLILPYFIIFLIVTGATYYANVNQAITLLSIEDMEQLNTRALNMMQFVQIIQGIVALIFLALLFQFVIEGLTVNDEKPVYKGVLPMFLARTIIGFLVTSFTYGLYGPWFLRNIIRFFAENTYFKEKNFLFRGNAFQLLTRFLGGAVFPVIAVSFLYSGVLGFLGITTLPLFIELFMITAILLLAPAPFFFFYLQWLSQFSWNNHSANLVMYAPEGIGFILKQMLLILVSLGFYTPAAVLNIIRFFGAHIQLTDTDGGEKTFQCDFDISAGWWFLLKQGLLTLITAGIYGPWAFCRSLEWLLPQISIVPREFTETAEVSN